MLDILPGHVQVLQLWLQVQLPLSKASLRSQDLRIHLHCKRRGSRQSWS